MKKLTFSDKAAGLIAIFCSSVLAGYFFQIAMVPSSIRPYDTFHNLIGPVNIPLTIVLFFLIELFSSLHPALGVWANILGLVAICVTFILYYALFGFVLWKVLSYIFRQFDRI